MKLKRGQIGDIADYTGYSVQYIHQILNKEKSQNSLGGKKILKVIEILEKNCKDLAKKIEKALKSIEWDYRK